MSRGWKRALILVAVLMVALPITVGAAAFAWFSYEGDTNGSVMEAGKPRNYLLHVGRSYDGKHPVPLVISLHPAASRPAAQQEITGWDAMADRHGFMVVYPSGSDTPRIWPTQGSSIDDDTRYVGDIIDTLRSSYNIDATRIYADGISNGGTMAFALSCRMSDRIAAIGAVAAPEVMPWKFCDGAKPVPTVIIHGTADPVVPIGGGTSAISPVPFPPMTDWLGKVAKKNGCGVDPKKETVTAHVQRWTYPECAERGDLVFYRIEGGGHTWPGGKSPFPRWIVGDMNHEINATEILWQFFQQHPMQPKP